VHRGELLEEHRDVVGVQIRAQCSCGLGTSDDLPQQAVGLRGEVVQLSGRRERPGQPDGERVHVRIDDAAQEHGEGLIRRRRQRLLCDGNELLQAVPAEPAQQLLLRCVAAIQPPDADSRCLGHCRHGCGRVADEHVTRGFEDHLVVARGLGGPPAGAWRSHATNIPIERNGPFR
jgi:hypothetical protein